MLFISSSVFFNAFLLSDDILLFAVYLIPGHTCFKIGLLMEKIHEYFKTLVPITDEEALFFSSKLTMRNFKRNTLVLQSGKIENYLSFIEKGTIRYFTEREDKEITFGFALAGSFESAYDSFLKQTPSHYHIQTLEDTVLWSISYDDLQEVYTRTSVGQLIGRKASEELFILKSEREKSLLLYSAGERYEMLLSKNPELFRKIPLKYIASYLGITPQALSRIRRRIS